MFQMTFKCQGCFKKVSRKFEGGFRGFVTRVFKESFKHVLS